MTFQAKPAGFRKHMRLGNVPFEEFTGMDLEDNKLLGLINLAYT